MQIILVEDEPATAHMLAKGLREQGYAVDIALDGEDGAYKATISNYNLLILDVLLPLKDQSRNPVRRSGPQVRPHRS